MIRLLALTLAALALGGALAAAMLRDAGYVLIAYDGATLETSLWFAAAALVAVGATIYLAARLWRATARGGQRLGGTVRARRRRTQLQRAQEGAVLLFEGRWREAERALREAAPHLDAPLLSYAAAARAANEAGRFDARDALLEAAKEAAPDAAQAVELVRSEQQQAAGQWQPSVATLTALREALPRHPLVQERLAAAHQALGNRAAAAELAPEVPAGQAEAGLWRARLAKSRGSADAALHARRTWRAMPRALRQQEALVADYADTLAHHGAAAEAEALLRRSLGKHWRASWVRRYGALPTADAKEASERLATASAWLSDHPEDPALLLALGRLARAAGDEAQAKRHLSAAALAEDAEALAELAALSEAAGDAKEALGYLRRALQGRQPASGG